MRMSAPGRIPHMGCVGRETGGGGLLLKKGVWCVGVVLGHAIGGGGWRTWFGVWAVDIGKSGEIIRCEEGFRGMTRCGLGDGGVELGGRTQFLIVHGERTPEPAFELERYWRKAYRTMMEICSGNRTVYPRYIFFILE